MLGEPMCSGRRCVVVGSAPGVELPPALPNDIIIGANGGAAIARAAGRRVDLLVTTSHLFNATNDADKATLESMRDFSCSSMWVDTRNGTLTQMRVEAMNYKIEALEYVDVGPTLRDRIVMNATGNPLWVSTGVWAACLAVVSNASHIQVCGISLVDGHAGMPWDKRNRCHVQEDAATLRLLGPMGVEMPIELVEAVIQ